MEAPGQLPSLPSPKSGADSCPNSIHLISFHEKKLKVSLSIGRQNRPTRSPPMNGKSYYFARPLGCYFPVVLASSECAFGKVGFLGRKRRFCFAKLLQGTCIWVVAQY